MNFFNLSILSLSLFGAAHAWNDCIPEDGDKKTSCTALSQGWVHFNESLRTKPHSTPSDFNSDPFLSLFHFRGLLNLALLGWVWYLHLSVPILSKGFFSNLFLALPISDSCSDIDISPTIDILKRDELEPRLPSRFWREPRICRFFPFQNIPELGCRRFERRENEPEAVKRTSCATRPEDTCSTFSRAGLINLDILWV